MIGRSLIGADSLQLYVIEELERLGEDGAFVRMRPWREYSESLIP